METNEIITPEIAEILRRHEGEDEWSDTWSGNFCGLQPVEVAVIVVCHRPYLRYLAECLDSVEAAGADERILVLDNCAAPPWLRKRYGWTVLQTFAGSPNPGRNMGIDATESQWLCFVDADDTMHPEYLNGAREVIRNGGPEMDQVGLVCADLEYNGELVLKFTDFDYWALRRHNYVSTSSVWRRTAMEAAGSWQETTCYDDWTVALNMTRQGWRTAHNPIPIQAHRRHAVHRATDGQRNSFSHVWDHRTYAILTLLAGRGDCLGDWQKWLAAADVPPKCELWVGDNSDPRFPNFQREIHRFLQRADIQSKYDVRYVKLGEPCDANFDKWEKHRHVAKLYSRMIPKITTDMLVMLEDDVVPPVDGLKSLVRGYKCEQTIGISGVYASRTGPNHITGARGKDYWHDIPTRSELPSNSILELGFIAGGFTLWNMGYVKECLPFSFEFWRGSIPGGWDSQLCRRARAMGGRIFLHTGVDCEHKIGVTGAEI